MSMYGEMAEATIRKAGGNFVWCKNCHRKTEVDHAAALSGGGWPKCCGYTMTIDPPDTWGSAR